MLSFCLGSDLPFWQLRVADFLDFPFKQYYVGLILIGKIKDDDIIIKACVTALIKDI